ncbi:hypothetical protein SAVIM40S_05443 [Streptomyces avidinii]
MLPVRGGDGRKLTVWGPVPPGAPWATGSSSAPPAVATATTAGVPDDAGSPSWGCRCCPAGDGPVIECQGCRARFDTDVLDHLTTTRFTALLRDAVHTVALAVLTAGGTASRSALEAAVGAVRAAGFQDCTEEQLESLVEALSTDEGRLGLYDVPECCGAALSIELHEALEPLAPHLAGPGRESILLQGARIALADGPYTPAEREVLATVGSALRIDTDEVSRLLSAVRAP